MNQFKKYIVLWITQSVSQLGSAMTGFALTLWTYTQIHSAMAVSLMTFCNYVPFILVSLFTGAFVDKHSKKAIMLISDSIAAACTIVPKEKVSLRIMCLSHLCNPAVPLQTSSGFWLEPVPAVVWR